MTKQAWWSQNFLTNLFKGLPHRRAHWSIIQRPFTLSLVSILKSHIYLKPYIHKVIADNMTARDKLEKLQNSKYTINLGPFKTVRSEGLHTKLPLRTELVMHRLLFFTMVYFKLGKFILPLRNNIREFPGRLVVRIQAFTDMAQDQSLVGELRSCQVRGTAKKKTEIISKIV